MRTCIPTFLNVCSYNFVLFDCIHLPHECAYEYWMRFHLDDATDDCECSVVPELQELHEYVARHIVHVLNWDGYYQTIEFSRDQRVEAFECAVSMYAKAQYVMLEVQEQ